AARHGGWSIWGRPTAPASTAYKPPSIRSPPATRSSSETPSWSSWRPGVPIELLTLLKFLLLFVLYVFIARTMRAVTLDLYGPRRRAATPPRPAAATPPAGRRSRKIPKEIVVHGQGGRPLVVPLGGRGVILGRARSAD